MAFSFFLSFLLVGRVHASASAAASDCCLCEDCDLSSLSDAAVIASDALPTTCENVAFDLLFHDLSKDECMKQQDMFRKVCCPTLITVETKPEPSTQRHRLLFWDFPKPSSYLPWSSSQSPNIFKPSTFTDSFSQLTSSFGNTFGQISNTLSQWGSALTSPVPGLLPQVPSTSWGNNNGGSSNSGGSSSNGGSSSYGGASSQQWVDAHNTRRSRYHRQNNVAFVPLKWSNELSSSANTYTQRLLSLSGCQIRHGFQNDRFGGENLAAQTTYSGTGYSPEQVLQAWYEGEENLSYPDNGHLTQVVWRGTRYVGCATGSKSLGSGRFCHIETCRYLAPGNCNGVGNILQENTSCGPQCPVREGCF